MTELVPAYEGKKPYLFVSYAHKDSEFVLPVIAKMFEKKYRVWYDEGIAPGSEWPKNIADHLNAADAFLIFVSENSLLSPNCENEVIRAKKSGKDITQFSIHSRLHPELKGVRTVFSETDLLASIAAKYVGDGSGYDRGVKTGTRLVTKILLAMMAIAVISLAAFFATADRAALAEKALLQVEKIAGLSAGKLMNQETKEIPDTVIKDKALSTAVDREITQKEKVTLSYADDRILEDLANNNALLMELRILSGDMTTLEPLMRCRKLTTVYLPLSTFPVTIPENASFEVVLR